MDEAKHKRYTGMGNRLILENIIKIVTEMEDGEKKDHLIKLILNQMKRAYVQWNKLVDDDKIYADFKELSGGKISLNSEDYVIPDVKITPSRARLKKIKHQRRR